MMSAINLDSLFKNCYSLTSVNLSNLDTSNVKAMSSMFENCGSLISLDLSHFITSGVTNMSNMFNNCTSLEYLKVSFNTEKVTNMEYMFGSCINLSSLDISTFNTKNCLKFDNMFENDEKLKLTIDSSICANLKDAIPDYVEFTDISGNL